MSHDNKPSVGIDVSSRKLDVATSNQSGVRQFDYSDAGLQQLRSWLQKLLFLPL